jgi:ribosomal protein S12 methylthiotransferase accessory factor
MDIFLKENSYSNSKYFHSCRVAVSSDDLYNLNIGSGGKGMSIEYSLASAYAEFMERLQNDFLLSGQQYAVKNFLENNKQSSYSKRIINENLTLDYIYDNKKKSIPIEQSIHENLKFYLDIFPFIKNEKDAVSFFRDELNGSITNHATAIRVSPAGCTSFTCGYENTALSG